MIERLTPFQEKVSEKVRFLDEEDKEKFIDSPGSKSNNGTNLSLFFFIEINFICEKF